MNLALPGAAWRRHLREGPRGRASTSAGTGASSRAGEQTVSEQAIIKTGGKQYRVELGGVLRVEKLAGEIGSAVSFDEVLFVGQGAQAKVGTPHVAGAAVSAEIVGQGRGKKLIVYKFRRRKNFRRKNGHRQSFTELKITGIRG